MANISQIKLPNGTTYNVKDNSGEKSVHNHELASIVPITSKTYASSSYYATSSGSWEAASWYFMSVKPDTWDKPWKIRIRVHSFCPGYSNVESYTDALITGRRDGVAYSNYTERLDTAHYYIPYYTLKKAGFDAGLGHAIGVSILYGTGYTTASYYRTFEVDFYESENCTVTFFDTPVKWSSWTNGNTTNYNSLGSLDAVTRGYTESGDRNDVNYQNRIYYTYKKPYATLYRYQILLSRADGTLLPVNSVDNAPSSISKTLTTEEFDPFGEIYYYNSSTTRTTSQNLDNNVLYRQILADLRFSFNITNESGKCLTGSQPVYIVATPQSNGMAKLASPALVQALPSTEDGKIYIYIGQAYPDTYPYRTELPLYHPIYWYKNGAICQYIGNPYTVNGHTVNSDVPTNAKFTDTVTTVTTSGSGNAVTSITASSGALTVTKGSTFLTSFTETDPTVPAWAKASSKPTYTASEVGALASDTTYVSTVTTTAGTHTAISSKSGAVSFNVPTKTSHLTNDSGFITSFTDTKLQVAAVTSGTTYYPIVGTGTTAATRQYDTTGFVYVGTNGTTSAVGSAKLTLGNSTASGTANNKQGQLIIYGSTAYAHTISGAPTAARTLTLPNATGTIALTSDIPDVSGKIDTAGTGLSKSGTTLNHSNSVTAQTTQALYPIKIDAQGHISAYGTAVTSLPASDVYSWAKASSKPTYTASEVGAATSGHTHTTSIATSTGTNQVTLAANTKYVLTAGGTTYIFTTPPDTNTTYTASTTSIGSASAGTAISADDITAWTTDTPTAVTKKTVVTSASGATAAVSNGVLTLTDGSFGTGDSVTVTAGTAASLSYTSRSIPNISVTSKTVATGITAN